jgi:protoporphyrinogen oxidase
MVVIGAGVAGLAAAAELRQAGRPVVVLEAEPQVGGLARTLTVGGLRLEFGPHFVTRSLAAAAGVLEGAVPVSNWEAIHYRGKLRSFPFGLLKEPALVASVGLAYARALGGRRRDRDLAGYLEAGFGSRFAHAVAIPLVEKWAGAAAATLAPEMAGRLDPPELGVLWHHLRIVATGRSRQLARDGGDYWVYPAGGAGAVCEALARRHELDVRTGTPVTGVLWRDGRVHAVVAGGRELAAAAVISTLPRDALRALLHPQPPSEGPALRTRAVIFLSAVVAREHVRRFSWTWFPESTWRFYRVSEPRNTRVEPAPRGWTVVQAELACDVDDALWRASDAALGDLVRPQLQAAFDLHAGELGAAHVIRAPHAYPVLAGAARSAWEADPLRSPLRNLVHAGRFGVHRHLLMHDAYASGIRAARCLLAG